MLDLKKIHPIRATLAISAWGVILYLSVVGQPVSVGLWAIASAITILYFATAED